MTTNRQRNPYRINHSPLISVNYARLVVDGRPVEVHPERQRTKRARADKRPSVRRRAKS